MHVAQVLRLTVLAFAVAPMVRWAIVYSSTQAGQDRQRACPQCDKRIGANNWRPLKPLG